jgi:endonuclease G, mitochondrial
MRKLIPFALIFIILIAASAKNLPLPSNPGNGQIVKHYAYTLCYEEYYEQPSWVVYKLSKKNLDAKSEKRKDNFRADPAVSTGSAIPDDYKNSGYDKGHMAPAADFSWSEKAMSESFFMSNMSPQKPSFNRGVWKNLEELVRTFAGDCGEIYIVTGPVLNKMNFPTIGKNEVAAPEYYYKVILDLKKPEYKGVGFILSQEDTGTDLAGYAVTIDSVEALTGIDFFPSLKDDVENEIESSLDLSKWGLDAGK